MKSASAWRSAPAGRRSAADRQAAPQTGLVGVAIGVAGAVVLGQSLTALVYGVRATDPVTYAMAVVSSR